MDAASQRLAVRATNQPSVPPAPTTQRPPLLARTTNIPPPLAAPTVRRRQASRAPFIEERLTARSSPRYLVPDDDVPRSRRPRAASIRPLPPLTAPRPPRSIEMPEVEPADPSAEALPPWSSRDDKAPEWPFDLDAATNTRSKSGPRGARVPSESSEEFADGVQDVLARLRPADLPTMRVSNTGSAVRSLLDSWQEAEAGSSADRPETSSARLDRESALAGDDDSFNPFIVRDQRDEEEAANATSDTSAFGSFSDQSADSVPSGLQAMFGSMPIADSSRAAKGDSGRSALDAESVPSFFSDAPAEERLSEIPPSRLSAPGGFSADALEAALGDILGSKFPAAVAGGAANMANQLDELLEDAARTPVHSPEVEFGDLKHENDDATSSRRDQATSQGLPSAAETLRGAHVGEGIFDENRHDENRHDDDDDDSSDAPPPSSWGEEPIRRSVLPPKLPSSVPSDDVLDVDADDVTSVPPAHGMRWPEGNDDFADEPVRRRSSNVPHSSEPPADDDDEAAAPEDDDDRASEWGESPVAAGSITRSIPNYDASLEELNRPLTSQPPEPRRIARTTSARPASRQTSRGLWLATALVVAAVALTLLPWYLLTRAEKFAQNCFRDLVRTAEGDPEACRPSTGELALARNLPWLKDDARRIQETSDFRAARLAYDKATAIVPNPTRRDDAALRLLDLTYRGTPNERTAALGVVAGAHAAVTQFALANRDPVSVSFALRSARATADLDAMRALSTGSSEEDPFGMSLRRGALLCLLGDPEEGARAFAAADLAQQRIDTNLDGHGLARLGLIACGKPKGVDGELDAHRLPGRYRPALAALEASLDTTEGLSQARSFLEDGKVKVGGIQRLRLAPYVLREAKPSALEALRLMAPLHAPSARLDLAAVRTPWMMFDVEAPVQAVYIDTRAAEVAAPYLEALAEKVNGKPLDCSGEECPDPGALKMPDSVLKEAARMVWFDAAAEHARLGHREAAIEAAGHATELAIRTRRYLAAPILLAVGDAEGALALLTESLGPLDGYTPLAQARIHLNHALALAHLGRFEKALGVAEEAFKAAVRAEEVAREQRDVLDAEVALQEDKVAAAWLWGAMALAVGKPDGVSEALRDANSKELAEVASWVGLATRPEEERRPERWELALAMPSQPALPAVMYVVGRAVPSMTDVEVWQDRVFQQEHRSQPVRSMLARAEAARWRNAPEAERNWQSRAAKMLGLIKDYKTSMLAHILELH